MSYQQQRMEYNMKNEYICGCRVFGNLKDAIDYSNRYFMQFGIVLGVELL